MKILITGATGFIGEHLVRELSKSEHQIVCLVRKKSKADVIEKLGNIKVARVAFDNQEELLQHFNAVDTVIHLAGQMGAYGVPYETFYQTNCVLTEKLLEVSLQSGVKHFIYCSTPGVLGFGKRLAAEKEAYAPRNAYEKTKVIAEEKVKAFCTEHRALKYTILRPDFVYGPGDTRRVKMYRGIKERKFVLTTSGKSYLHPTYIDDVIDGIVCCIANENAYNETFNLAAEKDVTAKEYLNCIAQSTGSKLIHINVGIHLSRALAGIIDGLFKAVFHKEGFVSKNKIDFLAMDHSSSIKNAQEKLGYHPKYSCKQGIENTILWCKKENLL